MAYRPTEYTRGVAEQRRARFLQVATATVARDGFAGATVKAIAAECETSVGTLYSYFDSRAHLLTEVFRAAAAHELAAVTAAVDAAEKAGAPAADQIDALVATFASRALAAPGLAYALLFEPADPGVVAERLRFREAYHGLGAQILRGGTASGELADQHTDITAAAVIGAISEALVGRLAPAPVAAVTDLPSDQTIAEIQRFCRRAIGVTQP